MPHLNGLIERFSRGEFAVGSWVPIGEYGAARAIGDSSADFTLIDMEHLGFSFPDLAQTMQWMVSRASASAQTIPASPIVRIPPNASERNQWIVKQTLDLGSFGILQPHSSHSADIEAAVSAIRYPQGPNGSGPAGHRGSLPMQAMRYWGVRSLPEFFESADLYPLNPSGELLLILLVEDAEAWENIDELVAVPGVGAVLWGPGDGGVSLGIHSLDANDPALDRYRDKVVEACKAAKVPVGFPTSDDLIKTIDEGFDFAATAGWDEAAAARARDYWSSRKS